MVNNYTSDDLFHFVGHKNPCDHQANFATLCKVLDAGCVSYPPHNNDWGNTRITVRWDRSLVDEELVVPEVTCFCDIPENHLSLHMIKYGYFGLSFPRSYLTLYGARPVMYVPLHRGDMLSPHGRTLLTDLSNVYGAYQAFVVDKLASDAAHPRSVGGVPESAEAAMEAVDSVLLKDLLAYIKPFDADLPHDHPDNFYMEREWRKYGNLKFEPNHVQRIVVARGYGERLAAVYPTYAGNVLEVTVP